MMVRYRRGDFVFEAVASSNKIRVNVIADSGTTYRQGDGFVCRGVLELPLNEWEDFVRDLGLEREGDGTDRG